MSRIPYITRDRLTEAQKRVFDHITQGKRSQGRPLEKFLTPEGGLQGPFNIFLFSPDIGDAVQRLGEAVRFETSIPPRLKELAILIVSANMKVQYEWWAHARIAEQEGVETHVIERIKAGDDPEFKDPLEIAVYEFAKELVDTGRVSDAKYAKAVEMLGDKGVVELTFILGYFNLVAMALNTFEIPIPPGEKLPFSI